MFISKVQDHQFLKANLKVDPSMKMFTTKADLKNKQTVL